MARKSKRMTKPWAIVDRLDRALHRPRAGPLQGVLAGLRGLPGARTKKAHVGRNCTVSAADVGAWDGAVAVQQVLFPGHSLARAGVGVFRARRGGDGAVAVQQVLFPSHSLARRA